MKKLIILDRDGVINEDSDDYIKSPEEWIEIPGSAKAIGDLCRAGYTVTIATNQSGLGRGYFSKETLDAIHNKMIAAIEREGGKITGIFYCPHKPDENCYCRKPKTGLTQQIQQQLNTDLTNVPFVGDSLKDLECARDSGCRPLLVKTGKGENTLTQGFAANSRLNSVTVFNNLQDVVAHLIQ